MASARDQTQLSCSPGSFTNEVSKLLTVEGAKNNVHKKITREDIAHVEELESLRTETHKRCDNTSQSLLAKDFHDLSPCYSPQKTMKFNQYCMFRKRWNTSVLQASHLKFNTCTHKLLQYTEHLYGLRLWYLCWKGPQPETHSSPSPR